MYSKTSLNQPTIVPTLNSPFREVFGLKSYKIVNGIEWANVSNPNQYQYRGKVELWRWLAREALLYIFTCIYNYDVVA